MPELNISEDLYEQLESEADGEEIEEVLWDMVAAYRRGTNSESDTE